MHCGEPKLVVWNLAECEPAAQDKLQQDFHESSYNAILQSLANKLKKLLATTSRLWVVGLLSQSEQHLLLTNVFSGAQMIVMMVVLSMCGIR